MPMTPAIAIHLSAALAALAIGPLALWSRLGARPRPRLHRAFGSAWMTLLAVAAVAALVIRDRSLPGVGGFSAIHLFVPITFAGLFAALRHLARGDIAGHRRAMQRLYVGACVLPGAFAFLPGGLLATMLWTQSPAAARNDAAGGPAPVLAILARTPPWAWALLAVLVAAGVAQSRPRRAGAARVLALPLAMTALSAWSAAAAFGGASWALAAWAATAAGAAAALARHPTGAQYDSAGRVFTLPGSWLPLALMVGIFLTRYAVAVSLALEPQLATGTVFPLLGACAYGALAGVFLGRALSVWQLAWVRPAAALAGAT